MKRSLYLIGALVLITAALLTATTGQASAATSSRVTYCETFKMGAHYETVIDLANGESFTVTDIRSNWSPFLGVKYLVESPVRPRMRRVMDCRVVKVNGGEEVMLTTVGGAEWFVFRARVAS